MVLKKIELNIKRTGAKKKPGMEAHSEEETFDRIRGRHFQYFSSNRNCGALWEYLDHTIPNVWTATWFKWLYPTVGPPTAAVITDSGQSRTGSVVCRIKLDSQSGEDAFACDVSHNWNSESRSRHQVLAVDRPSSPSLQAICRSKIQAY